MKGGPSWAWRLLKPRLAGRRHGRVQPADRLAFLRQLATLFRAGTPLVDSLRVSADQSQSDRMVRAAHDVADRVSAGSPLHSALGAHPRYFRPEWVQVVRSGEESGELAEVLDQLASQYEAADRLKRKLISAMVYPSIVLVVAVGAVAVMLVHVVPTFAEMFATFGKELPPITVAVMDASDFLQRRGLLLLAGAVLLAWLFRLVVRRPHGRLLWDRLRMALPVAGPITVMSAMHTYADNMALLMRAGVPLLRSMEILEGVFTTNAVYRGAMAQVGMVVGRGGRVADAVERTGVFTSLAVSMTRVGEESGELAEVLTETAEYYRTKVEAALQRLTTLLEAVVILGMGLLVAVILTALYLPMFSLASGVR